LITKDKFPEKAKFAQKIENIIYKRLNTKRKQKRAMSF